MGLELAPLRQSVKCFQHSLQLLTEKFKPGKSYPLALSLSFSTLSSFLIALEPSYASTQSFSLSHTALVLFAHVASVSPTCKTISYKVFESFVSVIHILDKRALHPDDSKGIAVALQIPHK